ncbi:MAG: 2-dehydro-3-deoxyglucarate aldolase [Planctomycetes bacterium]|nr:2-dehydro-3-deoxyglucarate aldolase [Planctomycetota bacterium]
MKHNPVKRLLKDGKPTFGTWLSLGNVFATRVLARVGFQWLTVDLEHSPIDWETAGYLFGSIADAGCVPLARVPRGDHDHIKRVLDAGAYGIVVPMVNTVEEARLAVAAAKYPPVGNRSLGGGMHALNFNAAAGEYYAKANDEIMVVLQTESPTGVQNAPEIYSLPGVDAIFVGPVDLRANMRKPDGTEASDQEFQAMMQRILEIGKKCRCPVGLHVMTGEDALRRAKEGWQFIAVGSELRMMTAQAQQIVSQVLPEGAAKDLARY